MDGTRMRRRDRLRSLASTTSSAIKQELSKYREPPLALLQTSQSSNTTSTNNSYDSIYRPSSLNETINDKIQCIIFPTYATLITDDQKQPKWKVKLTGWTFTLPGSSRVDRWMLAAGRTYGGVSANSAEYTHFTNLFNHFRSQTMRGIEMVLSWTETHIIEKINSGPSGRFEHTLYLDYNEYADRIQQKFLELEARFVGSGKYCTSHWHSRYD
ncbi:hypothetical protein BC941DRAFT_122612 [Chlamydoabsidia padenii]|nr:hypothetical protein BC941DRAFT_122612 [Chlamydoabsidia padenii]